MVADLQSARADLAQDTARKAKRDLNATEAKIARLVERILETDSQSLVATYEQKLKELEELRARQKANIAAGSDLNARYARISRTAMAFLANPLKLWTSGAFSHQKTVARLTFPSLVPYHPETGYRTADSTCVLNGLAGFLGND